MPNFATNATHGFFYRFIQPETVIGIMCLLSSGLLNKVFNSVFNRVYATRFSIGFATVFTTGFTSSFTIRFTTGFLTGFQKEYFATFFSFHCSKTSKKDRITVEKPSLSTG